MSWRDKLQQASFREVPFKVISIGTEVGRRTVLHQYPFNDEPYAEDLGKDASMYTVVGYIIQTVDNDFDYFAERDALIDALNTKGPGTLIHPWRGPITVAALGRIQLQETFSEGGIARFTMTFVDAGRVQVPLGVIAPESTADIAADNVLSEAELSFTEQYIQGPINLLEDTLTFISMVQDTIYSIQSIVTATISGVLTTIAGIRDTITGIIEAPDRLANAIQETFNTYRELLGDAEGTTLVDAYLELTRCGETDPAEASLYGGVYEVIPDIDTTTRDIQRNNRSILLNYIRVGAVAEATRADAYATYGDFNEAFNTLQKVMAAVEKIEEDMTPDTTSDNIYDALQGLKPVIVEILLQKGASAPVTLYRKIPADPKPSIVWAYELYDDLDREAELISRNPVTMLHPGFPLGGEELEAASV